jgi:hypothetical protein
MGNLKINKMTKKAGKSIGVHSLDDLNAIFDDFKNESDRATVILGAAKLDSMLYLLLTKFLKPTTNGQDELLDGDNPLGTFSSRINLAFRLGLINNHFTKSLHLIRKIRNSFAHEINGISLCTGGQGDRVRELIFHFKDLVDYQDVKQDIFGEKESLDIDFRMILAVTILRLDTAIHYAGTISHDGADLIPPAWEEKIDYDDDVYNSDIKEAKEVKE